MGFPLQLNKALARIKKHGLDVCTRWTLLEHVQSAQVGFPLLLNKEHFLASKSMDWTFYQGGRCWGMFRVGKWAFPCC